MLSYFSQQCKLTLLQEWDLQNFDVAALRTSWQGRSKPPICNGAWGLKVIFKYMYKLLSRVMLLK